MSGAFGAGEVGVEANLAAQYASSACRRDLLSVWQLDARLRRIFLNAREVTLGEIKLAWWEERLRGLRTDAVPPEPLLRQLAAVPTIDVSDLADMADGWRALFADRPWADKLCDHASIRGRALMRASAAALGGELIEPMLRAGEGFALVDLARRHPDREVQEAALAAARARFRDLDSTLWPRAIRPVGMLVMLARADARRGVFGRGGSPVRVARMAWHALTGR